MYIILLQNIVEAEADYNTSNLKQPRIQYIGSPDITIARVLVAGQKFMFSELLYAVEVLFKIFWTIDIEYPQSSSHVWQFMQFGVFEFDVGVNSPPPIILTCINDNKS